MQLHTHFALFSCKYWIAFNNYNRRKQPPMLLCKKFFHKCFGVSLYSVTKKSSIDIVLLPYQKNIYLVLSYSCANARTSSDLVSMFLAHPVKMSHSMSRCQFTHTKMHLYTQSTAHVRICVFPVILKYVLSTLIARNINQSRSPDVYLNMEKNAVKWM